MDSPKRDLRVFDEDIRSRFDGDAVAVRHRHAAAHDASLHGHVARFHDQKAVDVLGVECRAVRRHGDVTVHRGESEPGRYSRIVCAGSSRRARGAGDAAPSNVAPPSSRRDQRHRLHRPHSIRPDAPMLPPFALPSLVDAPPLLYAPPGIRSAAGIGPTEDAFRRLARRRSLRNSSPSCTPPPAAAAPTTETQ